MAVLKYKNEFGEYIAIPAGVPSSISVFDNDANYQTLEQVKAIVEECGGGGGAPWEIGDGLEVTPENHLRTESWLIPHDDGSVGEAIENLRMDVRGIRFIDLFYGDNLHWDSGIAIVANLLPADERLCEEVLNNFGGFECNIHVNGEEFGRGFSVYVERYDNDFIGVFRPEDWGDEWEFERLRIDTVNKVALLVCKPGVWFANQPIHRFDLQMVEVSRSVKQIDTDAGLWCDRMDGGERIRLGVNAGFGLRFEEDMVSVNQEDLFCNNNSYFAAWQEIGGSLDVSPLQWGLWTDENADEWVNNVVVDRPDLQLVMEFEDGGCAGTGGYELIQNGTAANGNQFDWIWDMTGVLGTEIDAQYGMSKIEICYLKADRKFYLVLSLGDTSLGHNLQFVRFGIEDRTPSLAHYNIGNPEKWDIYERDGMLCADPLNDGGMAVEEIEAIVDAKLAEAGGGGVEQAYVDEMDRYPACNNMAYRCIKEYDTPDSGSFSGYIPKASGTKEYVLKYLSLGIPCNNGMASYGSSYYFDITADDLTSIGLKWGGIVNSDGSVSSMSGSYSLNNANTILLPVNARVYVVSKTNWNQIPRFLNRFWYDNTKSGLKATDIPAAIDELKGMIDALNTIGVAEEGTF